MMILRPVKVRYTLKLYFNTSIDIFPGIADPGGVELSDIEVVALIEKMGFTIEKLIDGVPTPYIQSRTSMIQNIYRSSHWVARKN